MVVQQVAAAPAVQQVVEVAPVEGTAAVEAEVVVPEVTEVVQPVQEAVAAPVVTAAAAPAITMTAPAYTGAPVYTYGNTGVGSVYGSSSYYLPTSASSLAFS